MNAEAKISVRPTFRAEYGHFIDGAWTGSDGGNVIGLSNPATGQHLANIQAGTPTDVQRAVAAAKRAFPAWSRTSFEERQRILLEIAQRLSRRREDFAVMESMNNGKTVFEATIHDLPEAIGQFEYFAGSVWSLKGETHNHADLLGLVHREPLGVVAQIIPWNVPLLMASMKIAPALAAGNTIVLKPSEIVCLTVLEFIGEIADLLPPGVLNVITGYGKDVGEALVTHPDIRKVAFTGSTATGRKIIEYAARNIIPQTMELGGKSANIVCSSADLDAAATTAALAMVFNKGEVCMAGSRLFVERSVRDAFLEKYVAAVKQISVGDPLHEKTGLGSLSSRIQYDKVRNYFDVAREEGATILHGGEIATGDGLENGYFVKPTILGDVHNGMRVAQEEIFGPVTSVITWDNEEDLLSQVNDSLYGLAGAVWSEDLRQAHRLSRAMQTGIVWINTYYNLPRGMPLGGYKQSGFGRELTWELLREYTIQKSVIIPLSYSGLPPA
ncbi:aldehyde dehydrogenase family protein [Sphingobium subterraneum]|uniref:Acyl-CoA reductase-like NAD-dependent aldehyde dehydrogenase n=1 Tax=Sphingobium subterraneum TaxID=627688 RepID=A0A841J4J3_9SPHN|nr:aldehyde dehydrogenase family protein [Sphingobium subterraneum]MBB6125252.1 acyl-CoA reductase-like NAD-dependent aldehyde dehydrogenase [Sphingobium subterraneum]